MAVEVQTDKIQALFSQPIVVANVGLDLLADALEAEGVETARVDWRPPAIEPAPGAAALFNDPAIEAANQEAVRRMIGSQPMLVDV